MKSSGKEPLNKIRLQVFLSHNGVCSRRKAMDLIKDGKVRVNGRIEKEPSTLVSAGSDKVEVGQNVVTQKVFSYLLLNKPRGYVTTKDDPFAKKTVLDLMPEHFRHLVPAGRLDKDTGGLLILTNDGDMVYQLTHPKHNVDKVYFARISGQLSDAQRERLERGVVIDQSKTAPARISDIQKGGKYTEFQITIHEGRKRQIRLMTAAVGHKVQYLKRIAQGPIRLGDLKVGQWRHLSYAEIQNLKKL